MTRSIRWFAVAVLTLVPAVPAVSARELSFEDRVAAQKAIEQVYWNHRLWPKDNPGPKPTLADVMPDAAIRAKVEDYLKKSGALGQWWQQPVTAVQLQAELDRMTKNTRDGATLEEVFNALGSDPFLIAETLARQSLVERLIRSWYADDARFHGALKTKAERTRAVCASVSCMKASDGEYRETTWKRRADGADVPTADTPERTVLVDSGEWAEYVESLAAKLGAVGETLATDRLSGLQETPEAFIVDAVLEQREGEIVIASVAWSKRSFDAWWGFASRAVVPMKDGPSGEFRLPRAAFGTCSGDSWTRTRAEVPDGRYRHSVVWTGAEMIVWGGYVGGPVDTGGRYNPATDTWTPTSTTNAPSARSSHTAAWTGTEMLVWGGSDSSSFLSTGGRYNPSSDSWIATSTGPNLPEVRSLHTAVWTGTSMIVWGGRNNPGFLSTGGRYNPVSDSWLPTSIDANTPQARDEHSAVWTGTVMIVWGGTAATSSSFLNTGGRYDPSTDSWIATSTAAGVPSARWKHTGVWTGTAMIVWGGSSISGSVTYVNTGGRYNPSTDTWIATSTGVNVPTARHDHSAVWTGSKMVVWGGNSSDTGGRYDPANDSWIPTSTGPNDPEGRSNHSAVWTGTEMVVWGGTPNGTSGVNTGGRYNPSTDSWTATSRGVVVPGARAYHTAIWTGSEMIVWGGETLGDGLRSGGRYNPSTDSWIPTSTGANVPSARFFHTAVWTGTHMIIWGGGSTSNSGGRYNPATDSWTATSIGANVPSARRLHSAVWTGTEMIVWGGQSPTGYLNTGGRYNPSNDGWTAIPTGSPAPVARYHHTAVWTGTEMIVWGGAFFDGLNNTYLNTGGRYTPSTNSWTATSIGANVPLARQSHTAVWTGTSMIVWGGETSGRMRSGGRYDPSTNSWVATSEGPSVPEARSGHSAVWTGTDQIIWGGASGADFLNNGARYNPTTNSWTPTPSGANLPNVRRDHSAVWTGTQMIVWGGYPETATGGVLCACPAGRTYHRDADGDGFGDPLNFVTSCDGTLPPGAVDEGSDCDDTNPARHPSATEVCNGVDDDCNGALPAGESDVDGDGASACGGDCDDADPLRFPGAPEVNDGVDNQCPGDPGYGVIDELSGIAGFFTVGDKSTLSWTAQTGATGYETVRSPYSDFHAGCVHTVTASPSWSDPATPAPGAAFYYLIRSASPHLGSWGQRSGAVERTVCAGCQNTGDWCDDGNACSIGDVCSGGTCQGTTPGASHLVISQIQVAGNGFDPPNDEFIEIYNPTSAPVSLSNWSIQSLINTFPSFSVSVRTLGPAASIPAHGWYLVAPSGYNGTVAADRTNPTFSLPATGNSLFLVSSTFPVSSCSAIQIVDKVAYGDGTCPEGASAPAPSANNSILRKPGGACGNGTDTNSNSADFVNQSPSTPRNSSSPPQP